MTCYEHEIREADCPKCMAETFAPTITIPLADLLAIRDALRGAIQPGWASDADEPVLEALATVEGLLL